MSPYTPRQPKPTDPRIADHIESLFKAHPPAEYGAEVGDAPGPQLHEGGQGPEAIAPLQAGWRNNLLYGREPGAWQHAPCSPTGPGSVRRTSSGGNGGLSQRRQPAEQRLEQSALGYPRREHARPSATRHQSGATDLPRRNSPNDQADRRRRAVYPRAAAAPRTAGGNVAPVRRQRHHHQAHPRPTSLDAHLTASAVLGGRP